MRRLILVVGILAVLAALLQWHIGVRTDEAKYLLSIPYPHPPLVRTILGWTDGWSLQEPFWRLLFALILLSSSLLLPSGGARILWITSPAILVSAGTVMLAPPVAVYAMVLLWLLHRDDDTHPALIGILWIAMLFTAFQSVLLAPLIAGLLWKKTPLWKLAVVLLFPIALLGLYTASNPLAAASFVLQSQKDGDNTPMLRLMSMVRLWALGGGIVGAVMGIAGLIRAKNLWVILSFLLFCAYVFLGSFAYYAVFFVPFFAWGVLSLPRSRILTIVIFLSSVLTLLWFRPWPQPLPIRGVVAVIMQSDPTVTGVLIDASYGHEWQYESPVPVGRYNKDMRVSEEAVVCIGPCNTFNYTEFTPIETGIGNIRAFRR